MENLSKEEIQHLSTLLLSADDQNTNLAFEIMKGKPFSEEFITELFTVCKLSSNEEFKKQAQKELERLDSNMTKVLSLKQKLSREGKNGSGANEKTIAKNIDYYVSYSNNKLDGIKLAKCLVIKYGHGFQYLFDNLKGKDLIDYLETFKVGNRFDFSNKGVGKIPLEVFQVPGIEEVEEFYANGNKIEALPGQIGDLKKLKRLDLSSNNLKKINKNIQKCNNLDWLDISENNFKEFPVEICNCSSLIELRIINSASYFSDVFTIPEVEFLKLKNLRILYFHRERKEHADNLFLVFPKCEKLEELNLSEYTEIQEAVTTLQKEMPNCKVSTSKILSYLNHN
jgi:Leucine-rich repeat (LRR) protein